MDDPLWLRASDWILGAPGDGPAVDLIGVPSSVASITPSNARTAPAAFRTALAGSSPFDGERSIDLTSLRIIDRGDLDIDDGSMVASQAGILDRARELAEGSTKVFVGGDNAITRPLVRATSDDLGAIGVITLDAHHDVRLLDSGPTNGTPIRGLIEDGLPGRNVVQVGIHSFANSRAYREFCDDQGISIIPMDEVERRGAEAAADAALYRLGHVDRVYVDFDIDVLDRSFAPGCPGARPAGMTPRQLGAIAHALGRHPNVVAADLVEVDPDRDPDGRTVQAMVYTFLSFLSGIAERGRAA